MEEMEHLNNRKDWVSVEWLGLVPGQALWFKGSFGSSGSGHKCSECMTGLDMLAFGKAGKQYDSFDCRCQPLRSKIWLSHRVKIR